MKVTDFQAEVERLLARLHRASDEDRLDIRGSLLRFLREETGQMEPDPLGSKHLRAIIENLQGIVPDRAVYAVACSVLDALNAIPVEAPADADPATKATHSASGATPISVGAVITQMGAEAIDDLRPAGGRVGLGFAVDDRGSGLVAAMVVDYGPDSDDIKVVDPLTFEEGEG